MSQLSKYTTAPLSVEEECAAAKAWQERGDTKARDKIIFANLRFAMSVIKSAKRIAERDDLEQEVIASMMRALERFDYTLGYRFITYATSYILVGIENAEIASRNIRLPSDAFKAVVGKVVKRRDTPLSDESVSCAQIAAGSMIRLDKIVDYNAATDAGRQVHEYIADPNAVIEPDETDAVAHEVMLRTTPLEKLVLTRLCWDDKSLDAIGQEIGMCGERVRLIRNKAIERLRDRQDASVPLASAAWWTDEARELRHEFEGRAVKFHALRAWAGKRYAIYARRYLLHLLAWMVLEGRAEWFGETVRFGGRRAKLGAGRRARNVAA